MAQISKEYAEALFALACEEGKETEFLTALEEIGRIFEDQPDYAELLAAPGISLGERLAAAALAIAYLVFRAADKKAGNTPRSATEVVKPIWYFVLIMAVCLFANSFFKTQAALHLDAVMLYPLNQGCAVVLSLLMSSILFKEKINAKCIIGICLSFVALLMINLLK